MDVIAGEIVLSFLAMTLNILLKFQPKKEYNNYYYPIFKFEC